MDRVDTLEGKAMTPDHDWRAILNQIRATGLSYGRLSMLTGMPSGTIFSMGSKGSTPRYGTGEKLVLIWCERTAKRREELPTIGIASDIVSPSSHMM